MGCVINISILIPAAAAPSRAPWHRMARGGGAKGVPATETNENNNPTTSDERAKRLSRLGERDWGVRGEAMGGGVWGKAIGGV